MPTGSIRRGLSETARLQSHGLEDELSFGSDEDLMEEVGEINIPSIPKPTPVEPSAPARPSKSTKHTKTIKPPKVEAARKKQVSLAHSTHLLPNMQTGSTIDLPSDMFGDKTAKRGSLIGAFKGLRKKRDDQGSLRSSFDTQSSGTLSLSKIGSNGSSRPSISSSLAYSSSPSMPHHIGPLSLPPFDSSPDSHRLVLSKTSVAELSENAHTPSTYASTRRLFSDDSTLNRTLSQTSSALTHPSSYTASSQTRVSWSPSDITSAILPPFPATITSLEPIILLTAVANKRPSSPISSATDKHSMRSFSSFRTGSAPLQNGNWTPCTLVFTLFKVTIAGEAAAQLADAERTVAHLHVFSSSRPNSASTTSSNGVRRTKSSAGYIDGSSPRLEVERKALGYSSTAGVCNEFTGNDGRTLVLRVIFGEEGEKGEWLLEMKDGSQIHEWIKLIKKTALMIKAEEYGIGKQIRPAYETTTVNADELALKIHMQLQSRTVQSNVQSVKDTPSKIVNSTSQLMDALPESPQIFGSEDLDDFNRLKINAPTSSVSALDRRSLSLEALQGAALGRSRSVDDSGAVRTSLPPNPSRTHRKSFSGSSGGFASTEVTPESLPIDKFPINQASKRASVDSASSTSLSHELEFPEPPSALPIAPNFRPLRRDTATLPPQSTPPTAPLPSLPVAVTTAISLDVDREPESPIMQPVRPPTPPRFKAPKADSLRSASTYLSRRNDETGSIASTSRASETSSTSRLRRLRGKPQVIDIMAEFSAVEAELNPEEEEEPIREDRERRIRFA